MEARGIAKFPSICSMENILRANNGSSICSVNFQGARNMQTFYSPNLHKIEICQQSSKINRTLMAFY